jgi:4-hydroxy-tetrahydrodipicolinate synthase
MTCGRREFLRLLGASALSNGGARGGATTERGAKPLRGIFPIAHSPFTDADQLDIDALVRELHFADRAGVHGFVWPQLASEWSTLKPEERFSGAEAIAAAGKSLRPAIVIGVQAPDAAGAVRYAQHAHKIGADAIISLPPPGETNSQALLAYYKRVGQATPLPFFLQAVGDMSVDLIAEIHRAAPNIAYVKDEAGEPLFRIAELQRKSNGEIKVFTGSHGKTLIDEMRRGFSGSMPAMSFVDLYVTAWDAWHAGNQRQAMDAFSKAAMLITEVGPYGIEALKYILYLRGVFKTYQARSAPGRKPRSGLDENGKQTIRAMLDYLKPYLRA